MSAVWVGLIALAVVVGARAFWVARQPAAEALAARLQPPPASEHPYCRICALVLVPEPACPCDACLDAFRAELDRWGVAS